MDGSECLEENEARVRPVQGLITPKEASGGQGRTIHIRAHIICGQDRFSSSHNGSAHFTNDENVWWDGGGIERWKVRYRSRRSESGKNRFNLYHRRINFKSLSNIVFFNTLWQGYPKSHLTTIRGTFQFWLKLLDNVLRNVMLSGADKGL